MSDNEREQQEDEQEDPGSHVVMMVQTYCGIAMGIDPQNVRKALNGIQATHTMMPLLDPTRYRKELSNINDNAALLRAFLDFRVSIQKTFDEAKAREIVSQELKIEGLER